MWTKFEPCELPPEGGGGELYKNNRYQVIKRYAGNGELGPLWHLSIKRLDQEAIHDWRDLQRIKNELVGEEAEGMELYPAESRLVDSSNQYHLWVFEQFKFPFGYSDRLVSEHTTLGTVQRPFEQKPKDLVSKEELESRVRNFVKKPTD